MRSGLLPSWDMELTLATLKPHEPISRAQHNALRRDTAMAAGHFLTVAALAAVGTALLTGCGDTEPSGAELVFPSSTQSPSPPVATTTGNRKLPGVLGPYDTGVGRNGTEVRILSVTDEVTNYGPATVLTFQIFNAGDQIIDEDGGVLRAWSTARPDSLQSGSCRQRISSASAR